FFHSRSLKRKLFEYRVNLGRSLGEELLRPTYIYSPLLGRLVEKNLIHAAAHITGGGIPGNLSRVLPENLDAEVYTDSWNVPAVFHMIQETGRVKTKEMFNVFNMGIGLILCLPARNKEKVSSIVQKNGFKVFEIGFVCKGKKRVVLTKKHPR
ncbi:MAG: AIR synthase-related protein, partial [Candidatus Omnitrophica bacterium]|nr:AIR synthase-related protein [Candidatus Omnitrophota bacterium]